MRIVVADESEARFYDTGGLRARLQLAGRFENPIGRLRDRDLTSDRPGRVFDRAPTAVRTLEEARRQGQFDRLVLMAGAPFLGMLRAALRKSVRATVVAEVSKDLVHQTEREVRMHLPREIFQTSTNPGQHT